LLDDSAVGHDDDVVGVLDGVEAVGDDDGRAALGGDVEGFLDDSFGFAVECGCRFVEEED
jgi:hypothetical protein